MNLLLVAIGGAIGSVLRFILTNSFSKNIFPYGTLIVNFIGSFLIGIISFYFIDKLKINNNYILFLKIGFCGGFTTFSSFSLESFDLLQKNLFLALIYIFSSIFLCFLAIYFAKIIANNF